MTESPFVGVVVDLVDPYFTPEVKKVGGFSPTSARATYAIWWLRNHPGRWALVAEGTNGLTRHALKAYPDIFASENRSPRYNYDGVTRTYAQVPHPEAEPLETALKRRLPLGPALYLPTLGRDQFNWTRAELEDACKVAKANLFP